MPLFGLLRNRRDERVGFALYGAAVAAARDPFLYTVLGAPDTLDGRFDVLGLHAILLIHRLRSAPPPGPALAQAVFDAMFADMDLNLREMGVGDLSVGKRVRAMWEAFHGRARAYETALDDADDAALAAAVARNVWRGAEPPAGSPERFARLARAQRDALGEQPISAFAAGTALFLPAASAAAE